MTTDHWLGLVLLLLSVTCFANSLLLMRDP